MEPMGKKRKGQGGAEPLPRHRRRTLSYASAQLSIKGRADGGKSNGDPPPATYPGNGGVRGSSSPLPSSLPLFQPVPPTSLPLQGSPRESRHACSPPLSAETGILCVDGANCRRRINKQAVHSDTTPDAKYGLQTETIAPCWSDRWWRSTRGDPRVRLQRR